MLLFFREIVSNALALGDVQGTDYDMASHNYSPDAPAVHEVKE